MTSTLHVSCALMLAVLTSCGGGLHPCVSWQTRELARCGTVTVREDREAAEGRTIALRVLVLPGRMAPHDPDPVFVITGGPGLGATDLAGWATTALGEIRLSRDVVLVDVRGTGASAPLDCGLYEDGGHLQPFVDPSFPVERVRQCAARLATHADLARYTTSIIVDDLDDVRRALGYPQVNLLGASYGSRAALTWMRRHPASVRSAVLVGVSPPEAPALLASTWTGGRAMEHAYLACAADDACRRASPDPRADLARLLASLQSAPATARLWNWRRLSFETVTLTARGVAERLWSASYAPDAIVDELPAIHLAALGQYEELASRFVREARQRRAGRAEGMMLSVFCAEDGPRLAADTTAAVARTPVISELVRACASWPRGTIPADFTQPVRSDVPTLLLSGALDPVTPPELAESARHWLSRSRSYVDPGGGHGSLNDRARELIAAFIQRPNGPLMPSDTLFDKSKYRR
jgi:pimeloyl-ACP methyl ester carboxylesterase